VTPEQEEEVRRALAAVARAEDSRPDDSTDQHAGRHVDASLPPDVAARLDTVLAELVAPRVATAAPVGDDELAKHRRRRWSNAVVAAAALCVIGLAGGAVATGGFGLGNSSNDSQEAGSTADSGPALSSEPDTDSGSAGAGDRAGAAPSAAGSPEGGRTAPSAQPRELGATGNAPTLRTDTLRRDLTRLVDRPGQLPTGAPPRWRCVAPPLHTGEHWLGVRLDGLRSTLVLGVPAHGARTARVYSCADPDVLVASTTVHG
jgi:hypothetical protein